MTDGRDRRRNLALLALSLAVGLALAEAAVRLGAPQTLYQRSTVTTPGGTFLELDAELGWRFRPGARGLLESGGAATEVVINAAGYRDAERPAANPKGVPRVAVLGDSFVFGEGVPSDKIVTRLLEERLGDGTEVLNFGVSGYGTDQELLAFRRDAVRFRPGVVLLGFFWNDLMETASARIYGMTKPRFELRDGLPVLVDRPGGAGPASSGARLDLALGRRSHLYVLLRGSLSRLAAAWRDAARDQEEATVVHPVSVDFSLPEASSGRLSEFRLTFALIRELRRTAAPARFAVFTVPPRFLVDDDVRRRFLALYGLPPDAFAPDPFFRLSDFAAAESIAYVDLLPGFRRAHAGGRALFQRTGIHWNEEGHAVAAETLARALRQRGFVH